MVFVSFFLQKVFFWEILVTFLQRETKEIPFVSLLRNSKEVTFCQLAKLFNDLKPNFLQIVIFLEIFVVKIKSIFRLIEYWGRRLISHVRIFSHIKHIFDVEWRSSLPKISHKVKHVLKHRVSVLIFTCLLRNDPSIRIIYSIYSADDWPKWAESK